MLSQLSEARQDIADGKCKTGAQVLGQGFHVWVEAAKQKAAIGLEARHFGQVMGAFAVKAFGVTGRSRVLDLEQLAAVVEGPAVERAGIAGAVAGLVPAQHGAAMAAGVEKSVEFTGLVARDENRLAAHGGGQKIVDVGDLALVGKVDPVSLSAQ